MEKAERIELNQLWAELRAMQLITARLAARQFNHQEIELWHDNLVRSFEDRTDITDTSEAALVTAIGKMAKLMLDARDVIDPPPT